MSEVCCDSETFYRKLDDLKATEKVQSKTTLYIDDEFYDQAQTLLQAEEHGHKEVNIPKEIKQAIKRKKWHLEEGKIFNANNKQVIPKLRIYQTLCHAHSAIAHRGRDKTEKYIRASNIEISQSVIQIFVSTCKLHQQQKGVTDHKRKKILHPIQGNDYLSHVQIDLIDFRNLPCKCGQNHQWLLHVSDHHSKFSWLHPLKSKQTTEVADTLEKQFWLFGFPQKLHSDNGREFKSQVMKNLCEKHNITQVHGAPRTPSTQGLVERNNRTVKENLTNILHEQKKDLKCWCTVLAEAAYKKNIAVHRAIDKSPYEVVFGITPHKEFQPLNNHPSTEETQEITEPEAKANTLETDFEQQLATQESQISEPATLEVQNNDTEGNGKEKERKRKRQEETAKRKSIKLTVNKNQSNYNSQMKESRKKKETKYKVGDFVRIKIDKVDKTTSLHPNALLGQVKEIQDNYARIATRFGVISTFIAFNRLNMCQELNLDIDYSKEIPFSTACKRAVEQIVTKSN